MRVPTSTYRLQLRPGSGSSDAAAIVPYLRALGVGDVYASPILAPRRGSPHGYDVHRPDAASTELGGAAPASTRSWRGPRATDMGLLLDIVPNHMATERREPLVVGRPARTGRASPHARVFDIDWDAPGLDGKLLLPVLGKPLAEVVAAASSRSIATIRGAPSLRYYERAFPLAAATPRCWQLGRSPSCSAAQHYRLADWRDGPQRINYRRFFDITDLVALRVRRIRRSSTRRTRSSSRWSRAARSTGLRIDHVDGLRRPGGLPRSGCTRDRRRLRRRREDPRGRRGPAGRLARRGHHRLRGAGRDRLGLRRRRAAPTSSRRC